MTRISRPGLAIGMAAALALTAAAPSEAALAVGAKAPDFAIDASVGGKLFRFSLADTLKKGPVVLYFYPAAFTSGCTVEAHDFAEATAKYAELGATVIGVSNDKIDTVQRFSVEECRSKFAVGADPDRRVIKAYDAGLPMLGNANRTSYVIAPDASIVYEFTSLSPDKHVPNTLAALKAWKDAKR
jgi:peroxiredoxin